MRPTITDVAAAAEVSISTVSLVVNGKGPVSETTRSRVLAAVERLGYAPSRPARELATRRTGNVGFVLREDHFRRSEPFYTRVFLGAEFEARLRGTYVLLSTVPDPYDPAADAPRFLTEHSVDGVVVAGGVDAALLEQLGARQIPHVLADFAWGDTPAVAIDNAGGAEAVATHFAERGYARAVFLGAELDHPSPAARRDAFVTAAVDAGLPAPRVIAASGSLSRATGAEALDAVLADGPSAVFCANDALALGLLDAARTRGLRVPDDLAVAGFDDIDDAGRVGLTTVRVEKERLGEVALGLLVASLTPDAPPPPTLTVIPADLVLRTTS